MICVYNFDSCVYDLKALLSTGKMVLRQLFDFTRREVLCMWCESVVLCDGFKKCVFSQFRKTVNYLCIKNVR